MESSSNTDYSNSLRVNLVCYGYKDEVPFEYFEPSQDKTTSSEEQFTALVAKWLKEANQPYNTRNDSKGLWYPEDYIKQHSGDTPPYIDFISNPKYWNISARSIFIEKDNNHTPSEKLSAFFHGPTIGECASVLQACMYRALEELIGAEDFNHYLTKALTPFMITSNLFDTYHEKHKKLDLDPLTMTNPLYHLFHRKKKVVKGEYTHNIAGYTDNEIAAGDIIYIKGVDQYQDKHLQGAYAGWNLLCLGKNSEGENIYSGFGPETFYAPKTYAEIRKILIDGYNQEQSTRTKLVIANIVADSSHKDFQIAQKSASLANDKVHQDHKIIGIKYAIKFSTEQLKYYIAQPDQHHKSPWHSTPELPLPKTGCYTGIKNKVTKRLKTITPFSKENADKNFSNYQVANATQEKMFSIAKKFAHSVINNKKQPLGLVMTGSAGLGKTHLCVSVAKLVANAAKNVLFLDANTINNTYQKLAEAKNEAKIDQLFSKWIGNADLIVLDDINNQYGSASNFLKKAIDYCLKNKKALLVNSNEYVHIKENIPDDMYISLENPISNNFFVMQDIKGVSYRQGWWGEKTETNPIELLANYKGEKPAGIIIESNNIDLQSIKQTFVQKNNIAEKKVRVVGSPTISKYCDKTHITLTGVCSPDYFMHDADQYDVFVIQAKHDYNEYEQLLSLIPKIHAANKKIIVVTDNKETFVTSLQETIDNFLFRNNKQRLTDRIKSLFPEDPLQTRPQGASTVISPDNLTQTSNCHLR